MPDTDVEITVATPNEMPHILDVEEEHWGKLGRDIVADKSLTVLCAKRNGVVVGAGALVTCDLPTRTDLTPWIAGVWVSEDRRGLGIATKLTVALQEKAKELNCQSIYLFTYNAQTLYVRLGWKYKESSSFEGKPITIFEKKIGQ